ncbi:MAG: CcoQ/FixQ family Cbb3-type cytochrome c oxidase assembly chaperone [Nitrospirota bacterium]
MGRAKIDVRPIWANNEEVNAMQWSGWIYFGFTVALFIVFIVVVIYYYNPKKKEKIEKPKYKMFDDDEKI